VRGAAPLLGQRHWTSRTTTAATDVDSPGRDPLASDRSLKACRPGAELRFYEHVLSDDRRLARLRNAVAWFWPLVGGGCHPNRDTEEAIERAGFEIEQCERFPFRPSPIMAPVAPHVIGTGTTP
jgi:hypothetical protein